MKETAGLLPPRLTPEQLNDFDSLVSGFLSKHGYVHYGAFNFARKEFESVHNRIAFVAPQGEYVGFGNSAYSFINDHVYANYADLSSYETAIFSGRDPISMAVTVTPRERMSRFFVLGLKFFRVSRSAFNNEFGCEPEVFFWRDLGEADSE
jgi:oxygen-independent coproporphyrinogen-3 oxidase